MKIVTIFSKLCVPSKQAEKGMKVIMAFDGIVASAIVAELNSGILNGKINKIFQPNKQEVLIGIYNNGKNYLLNISIDSINYRLNLSTHSKPNPKNVFNFCMVLRKHLTGGTINKIYMNGLERVIYIDINCYNELNDLITKTLVIELMGKHSNIILLNPDSIIVDSLRHLTKLDNSIRDILPGYKYVSLQNLKLDFSHCSFDEFYNKLNITDSKMSSVVSNTFIGISKFEISCILNNLQIPDSTKISTEQYKNLYDYIQKLLSSIETNCSEVSCQLMQNSNKSDYCLVLSKQTSSFDINFFIDDFYFNKEQTEKFVSERNNILHLILNKVKKLSDKLAIINSKIAECSKMDLYKLYGELITSNLYKISNYNQDCVTLENYYEDNKLITIPLDSSITPSANAKKFFKQYRKLQNTYAIVTKQKQLVEAEIEYLDNIVYDINNVQNIDELNSIYNDIADYLDLPQSSSSKSNLKVIPNLPSEYKIDGFTILVGKNNKQNDNLTCKIAKNNDLWFHTKDIHGSHVVLRLDRNIKKVPDSIIYKCATIAAFYSKAKLSQNVPVDYTYIKYVKKPNGAKPGMVIYTDNKTLYVNPKNPTEY